jgi:hypothetical protein
MRAPESGQTIFLPVIVESHRACHFLGSLLEHLSGAVSGVEDLLVLLGRSGNFPELPDSKMLTTRRVSPWLQDEMPENGLTSVL